MTAWPVSRKSLIGVILTLTLVLSLVGVLSTTHARTTHAAGTKITFDRHNVLPIRLLSKYARKLNVTANDTTITNTATIPPCLTSTVPPRCYSPQQIRNAYSIQPLLNSGITGKGQTIVLIDFATSSTLQNDVHLYDQLYGLKDPKINVISPFSTPSTDSFAYQETALDVEIAHALAPDATIDLVLANVDAATTYNQLLTIALQSTKYAVDNNLGDVISQSFGVGESCVTPTYVQAEQQVFTEARAKNITVLASTGDAGSSVITCTSAGIAQLRGVNLPAADPLVTAVGGTTLSATVKTGQYDGEVVWNEESNGNNAATGGGISALFPVPDYQKNLDGLTQRAVPDVAFDADPFTGVPIVFSQLGSTLIIPTGGTSVGSPAWAAVVVLLNQKVGHRLGFLNPSIYALSASASYDTAFHDIRIGGNAVTGFDVKGNPVPVVGFDASPGWDAVTGVGTPIVSGLAATLAK